MGAKGEPREMLCIKRLDLDHYCVPSQQGALLPRPSFLCRTIQDLGIGTFRDLAVVLESAPILTALDIFVDRRVSALPVVNESGSTLRTKGSS